MWSVCLMRTASTFPVPGIRGDCSILCCSDSLALFFTLRGKTGHMLHNRHIETRISRALLQGSMGVQITSEHHWKARKQTPKNHSGGDFSLSFFGRFAAWLSFFRLSPKLVKWGK